VFRVLVHGGILVIAAWLALRRDSAAKAGKVYREPIKRAGVNGERGA
jgi:hypothetical protein